MVNAITNISIPGYVQVMGAADSNATVKVNTQSAEKY
jgi:hypothetical protein